MPRRVVFGPLVWGSANIWSMVGVFGVLRILLSFQHDRFSKHFFALCIPENRAFRLEARCVTVFPMQSGTARNPTPLDREYTEIYINAWKSFEKEWAESDQGQGRAHRSSARVEHIAQILDAHGLKSDWLYFDT